MIRRRGKGPARRGVIVTSTPGSRAQSPGNLSNVDTGSVASDRSNRSSLDIPIQEHTIPVIIPAPAAGVADTFGTPNSSPGQMPQPRKNKETIIPVDQLLDSVILIAALGEILSSI